MNIKEEIQELQSLIDRQKELEAKITKHIAPRLTNLNKIDDIYSIYLKYAKSRGYVLSNSFHRNKFIFVVLYFYSPITLTGGITGRGVRKKIAQVVGIASASAISDNVLEVAFLYSHYREFREDVDFICGVIKKIPQA